MEQKRFNSGYNRGAAVARIAAELNLSYQPTDEFGLINLLKDFELFKKGGRRKREITHILEEKSELLETNLRIFDYEYIGGGEGVNKMQYNGSKAFRQTVFFIQSKKLALPQFYMEPERFFHRVANFLGVDDIDFEAFPKFSAQYWLKGDDESAIRQSMNEQLLHFFTIEKYWNLEGLNYYLIFYSKNKVLFGDQLKMLYEKGKQIVELFSEK